MIQSKKKEQIDYNTYFDLPVKNISITIRCGECKQRLKVGTKKNMQKTIYVKPCPKCKTTKQITLKDLRELVHLPMVEVKAVEKEKKDPAATPWPREDWEERIEDLLRITCYHKRTEQTNNQRQAVGKLIELIKEHLTPAGDCREVKIAQKPWEVDFLKKVEQFLWVVKEMDGDGLTFQARNDLEEQMKINREILITSVMEISYINEDESANLSDKKKMVSGKRRPLSGTGGVNINFSGTGEVKS